MKKFEGYKKGINLGGWLSQCVHTKEHYEEFITQRDIERISLWNVDHVRLPIDYNLLEDENGNFKEDGFSYIDKAIMWCEHAKLNLVIDLHKTAGYSFDKGENESGFFGSAELQERFLRLWEELAKRYAVSDNTIAFELLNEVTEQSFSDTWNALIKKCITRIRKYAPNMYIIVGGYWQNSPDAIVDLDPPYDDKVIYNFHCYAPMNFTHQGAHWYEGMDVDFRMNIDECDPSVTPDFFISKFREAKEIADKNNTVLYCGEYGVIEHAKPDDVLKWFVAINTAFETLGISRAVWSYKEMDFGISDDRLDIIAYL